MSPQHRTDFFFPDTTGPSGGSLTATPASATQINLSWSGFTDQSGLRVTNPYVVVRATGGTAPANCSSGTVVYQGSNTSFNDTTVTDNAQYSYRVCAYDIYDNLAAGATASATTPSSQPTSTFLLHSNTTNGNTTFTDSARGKYIARYGGVIHSTAQKKFGNSSLYFPGSSYLQLDHHTDWVVGPNDFTIDCWAMLENSSQSYPMLISHSTRTTSPMRINFELYFNYNWTSNFTYSVEPEPAVYKGFSTSYSFNIMTWYHIAICRSGDKIYQFVNGNLIHTHTITPYQQLRILQSGTSPASLIIGSYNEGTLSNGHFRGWIDELRWVKGVAAWTSSFTPPSEPYSS